MNKETTIKITLEEAEKYSKWLLYECSDPIDEITFLISTILESNKRSTIEDVLKDMD